MAQKDVPGSVRIRTGKGNEWRFDAIERAGDLYDSNRSDAVAFACEDVVEIVDAIEDILEREDLTLQQRKEIANQCSSRGVSFDVELNASTEV